MSTTDRQLRLGLRANLSQFCLLVAVNALVGGMVGQEQTVLPLLAKQEFHLTGYTFLLTYVFAFGITRPPPTISPVPGRIDSGANRCCWWAGCSPYPFRCC